MAGLFIFLRQILSWPIIIRIGSNSEMAGRQEREEGGQQGSPELKYPAIHGERCKIPTLCKTNIFKLYCVV